MDANEKSNDIAWLHGAGTQPEGIYFFAIAPPPSPPILMWYLDQRVELAQTIKMLYGNIRFDEIIFL